MAKPTKKAPEIDDLLKQVFNIDRRLSIESNICAFCKKEAAKFRDKLSKAEFEISGMCQACQDEIFISNPDIKQLAEDAKKYMVWSAENQTVRNNCDLYIKFPDLCGSWEDCKECMESL